MNALFAGSFDPIHKGHLNIINKEEKMFDTIYVVVSINHDKQYSQAIDELFLRVKQVLKDNDKIIVLKNENKLTALLAQELNINYLIRGIRNNQDLNYEMEIAFANKQLNSSLETVFFIDDYGLTEISSSLKRQIEKIKQK